ncbi:MAG TPA: BT_3928 family protein [Chitinophagaceae bacterium]|jgi:uncharacterized membrane protein YphA (DoxX/SURF4 family)|nr:BT_3928 family protein [Chitinophagaceae bacterium]
MRIAVTIARWLVGVLFILSGLVKANDPLGLSYKMQEFFEIWNIGLGSSGFFARNALISLFTFLHGHSLALSLVMIVLEIVAGVALILGWRRRLVLNGLLLLIVFFTFLTAYAFWSGKFKNCGCFGDCLPITPGTSFGKDIALLVLIGFLIAGRRYITPLLSPKGSLLVLLGALAVTIGLQAYVLTYLPLADCLPFKKGNYLPAQMKAPPGALQDSFAIRFAYEKGGKRFEFAPEDLPADLDTYTFKERTDKLIRKGNAEPPIKGFSLQGIAGVDSTALILALPKAALLFCEGLKDIDEAALQAFRRTVEGSRGRLPVYIAVSASPEQAYPFFAQKGIRVDGIFACDGTVVRTAARTNPTLYYLEKGVVVRKWGRGDLEDSQDIGKGR